MATLGLFSIHSIERDSNLRSLVSEAIPPTTISAAIVVRCLIKTMLAHCNLKQNICLCSKQSSLFSFYPLPFGGKSKDAVVHWQQLFFVPISIRHLILQYFCIQSPLRAFCNGNPTTLFLKNGPIPASFVYFHSFLITISIQIVKSELV